MNLIEMQQKYLGVHLQCSELKAQLAECENRKEELAQTLAEEMALVGQKTTQVGGMKLTVRITPRIGKRKDVAMEDLCAAVNGTDLEFLVKPYIHPQTLQATLKEIIEDKGALPSDLEPMLRRWDQTVVAVTKG